MKRSQVVLASLAALSVLLVSSCIARKSDFYGRILWNLGVPIRYDPVNAAAQMFDIPRSRVIALAKLLGVDPQKIDDFSTDSLFPLNYYGDLLEGRSPPFTPPMHRSKVLAVVKGYAAMCVDAEGYGNDSLWYFFHSHDVVPPYTGGIPLVMVVEFTHPVSKNNPDPLIIAVNTRDLFDNSVNNPPWDTAYQECIEQCGKLGVIPE
jgi:hypothetical protein